MATRANRPGVDLRLRWWAVALPVATFAALLMLLASGTDADAATGADFEPLGRLVEHVRDAWLP
ncbi:hypothetical protein [Streptomyces sp. SBT349]|uniref:hypothetical protein n=1 Tax=Streptomyces sp. SBT349 TaxID=1580539 RepID=UPI00066E0B6F|nr:hypothetical protein [Streptomyces sp. SBT349]